MNKSIFAYMKEGLLALENAAGGASSEFMTVNHKLAQRFWVLRI
jgi:hypothetical protein